MAWAPSIRSWVVLFQAMEIRKADVVTGLAALVVAGPIGMVASPFVYRQLSANTKRPRLYWFLVGLVTLPLCWAPLLVFLPETPEQAAQRKANERIERAKASEKEFMDWAKSVEPLSRCEVALDKKLRDPDSYKADWSTIETRVNKEKKTAFLTWSFRAKNGFGGYDQGYAICNTGAMKDGVAEVAISSSP